MKKLYCIRDERAGLWYPPFPANTDQEATRAFGTLLQQRESMPAQHPQDFGLYMVASFDEVSPEGQGPVRADAYEALWRGDALLRFYDEIRPVRAELVKDARQMELVSDGE